MTERGNFTQIAQLICKKPVNISAVECFTKYGVKNPLCNDRGHCRLWEKTDEQLNYVLQPHEENSFLRACAGSGKTEVVGIKAAYEIKRWEEAYKGIAVLTFTNNAADVIRERVKQFAGVPGMIQAFR